MFLVFQSINEMVKESSTTESQATLVVGDTKKAKSAPVWHEVMGEDGNAYYWNTITNGLCKIIISYHFKKLLIDKGFTFQLVEALRTVGCMILIIAACTMSGCYIILLRMYFQKQSFLLVSGSQAMLTLGLENVQICNNVLIILR